MNIAILLLAAGNSQRYKLYSGEHKLLVPIKGKPLIDYTLDSAISSGLDTYLVTQPEEIALHRRVATERLITYASRGIGESIAIGVKHTQQYNGWVVALADMPFIRPDTYLTVAEQLYHVDCVRPCYQHQYGHPVGFAKALYPHLTVLQGDIGARHLFQQTPYFTLPTEDQGCIIDIDTPDSLARYRSLFP
ncbi:nucleotidyltransferase family protein [Rosenbergiella epipactidis]|uniref:nucleotidyltransferase family protein n=1 Tax=Rosenbergiella epipactidis TaxID=1544694 RepID=UPI002027279A|nr:nucleotidyltransferase family protein [Rosenbergiella epipactidis]MCL9667181.1 nucleotidyltransferase family protein [Rosenbergiella epipactidis]